MEIQSAFNSGVTGFRQATELANESAAKIASQAVDYSQNTADIRVKPESNTAVRETTSVTEELVNLRVAEHQALASARVIATADEVVGSLIDTRI